MLGIPDTQDCDDSVIPYTGPCPEGSIEVLLNRQDSEDLPRSIAIRFIFYLTSGKTTPIDKQGEIPESGINKPYCITSDELSSAGINPKNIEKIEIRALFEDGMTNVLDYINEIN